MIRTPCYKCENRTATCHGECEKYKDWLEKLRERKRLEAIGQIADSARSNSMAQLRRKQEWAKKAR